MNQSPFTICTFESRRREEMARLIERSGGIAVVAPSMKEIYLTENVVVFEFADRLLAGEFDAVVFMTGVGTEALFETLKTRSLEESVKAALANTLVIVRGPKPFAALSKLKVKSDLRAPEPNTSTELQQEILANHVELAGKRVAVQEYGAPSTDFYNWLSSQGAEVFPVPVYKWGLPDDLEPLRDSIRQTIAGKIDVLLWTSAQQLNHVLETAESLSVKQEWLDAANRCVNGSIGPTASERLVSLGLRPDLEPSHPKMAHLIRETIEQTPAILARKRGPLNADLGRAGQ
ncbi:uroporphyrinogen-III synthase [Planctomicrobium sp. SH668]|uniref:uroporphyrinogen-III synthase n=1 Tax=Planctomicrobium sp. SH668 TaxID=3448126 RepID=UPI003F5B1851